MWCILCSSFCWECSLSDHSFHCWREALCNACVCLWQKPNFDSESKLDWNPELILKMQTRNWFCIVSKFFQVHDAIGVKRNNQGRPLCGFAFSFKSPSIQSPPYATECKISKSETGEKMLKTEAAESPAFSCVVFFFVSVFTAAFCRVVRGFVFIQEIGECTGNQLWMSIKQNPRALSTQASSPLANPYRTSPRVSLTDRTNEAKIFAAVRVERKSSVQRCLFFCTAKNIRCMGEGGSVWLSGASLFFLR